jgi:hypothetical protein
MHYSAAFSSFTFAILQFVAIVTPHHLQRLLKDTEHLQKVPSQTYSRLQKVPGDSPAYYSSDPKKKNLEIRTLDLVPNPPVG